MFKENDIVVWTSQASSHSKEKVGVVVKVIPPESHPDVKALKKLGYAVSQVSRQVESNICFRTTESYVIAVGNELYWPRVKHLRKKSS